MDINNKLHNKNTDWTEYKTYINSNLTCNVSLKKPDELEDEIEKFNILIHRAISASTSTQDTNNNNNKSKEGVPTSIKTRILEKRKLRKIWQMTRNSADKTKLNKAIKDLKTVLSEYHNSKFQNYIESLNVTRDSDYSLWKCTKKIKRPQQFIPPIRKSDGNWARTNSEKADTFATHLCTTFQSTSREVLEEEESTLMLGIKSFPDDDTSIPQVKINEIKGIIKNLKFKKTPGYDNIDAKIIKELPTKAVRFIAILINACLRLAYFPDQWKVAQIIMILKPGKDPGIVSSYRPISLLPIISKILERLFLNLEIK